MLLHGGGPVHINVPISEPLYNFAVEELPEERKISMAAASADEAQLTAIADDFAKARKPLIVVGQMERREWHRAAEAVERLETRAVVLAEKLSDDSERQLPALDMLVELMADAADYQPDYIIYVGGNMVAKAMRQFLQHTKPRRSIVVSEAGDVADVMMNATDIVEFLHGSDARICIEHLDVTFVGEVDLCLVAHGINHLACDTDARIAHLESAFALLGLVFILGSHRTVNLGCELRLLLLGIACNGNGEHGCNKK